MTHRENFRPALGRPAVPGGGQRRRVRVVLGLVTAALVVAAVLTAAGFGVFSGPGRAKAGATPAALSSGSRSVSAGDGPGSPSPGDRPGSPSPGRSTPGQAHPPVGSHVRGPGLALVPSSGVYLGAYVQPASYTDSGEISAVTSFEQQVGHTIELVHAYHKWTSPFPSAADQYFVHSGKVLLLTWGGTPDTKAIIGGRYDQLIRARARAVRRLGRPILLEFRHEMDRPNLQWAIHGPASYIKAWDHIRQIFTSVGATNVGWVWCPTGYGFQVGRAQAFYPGDSEVNWVCADVYSSTAAVPLSVAAGPFLRWAAGHPTKPVILGEFAAGGHPSAWPGWLLAAGQLAQSDQQIKAMAYFDANGTDSNGNPFTYLLAENHRAVMSFARLLASRFFRPLIPRGA